MKIEEIRHQIDELSEIVASWAADSTPSLIEQDIVLSKLSQLYEGVKFISMAPPIATAPAPHELEIVETEEEINEVEEVEELSEDAPTSIDDSIFAIDMAAVSLVEEVATEPEVEAEVEVVAEVELEVVVEPAPELEPVVVAEPEERVEEESSAANNDNVLFDLDVIPKHNRRRRTVLMSLYDDDSSPKPQLKPQPQPQPSSIKVEEKREEQVVNAPQEEAIDQTANIAREDSSITPISVGAFAMHKTEPTIADVISSDVETVADRLSSIAPRAIVSDRLLYRSFDELGINERYLLTQELFGDDPQLCRQTLSAISAFDNYDDAMIYIAENFTWNPNLTGTKLLLSVLEQKFNIS